MNTIFDPDQGDAVIRMCAHRRHNFDLSLIHSSLSDHNVVRTSVAESFPSVAVSDLGTLDRLPLELLSYICLALDIRSCFKFRQINRRARQVVSGLYQYRAVAQHGLEALRSVLCTRISQWFTVPDLYRQLCTHDCALCRSAFGGFLFLPTVTRCCFACIESSPRLRVFDLPALETQSGISRQRLHQVLPVLRTLPVMYPLQTSLPATRIEVVAQEQAIDALRAFGFSLERVTAVLAAITEDSIVLRYMVSTAMPLLDPATGQVQHGFSCKACEIALEEALGVRSPILYKCVRVYSRQGYLHHFIHCAGSIKFWQASKGDTVPVPEPEFTRRRIYLDS